jgi:hypothetical protein
MNHALVPPCFAGQQERCVRFLGVVLLGALLLLYGCAAKTPATALTFSQAGQEVAAQLQANSLLTDEQLATFGKNTMFSITFDQSTCMEETQKKKVDDCNENYKKELLLFNRILSIQQKLTSQSQWLSSLRKAYAALGELAAYDAKNNFTTALGSLTSATNILATTMGGATIPSVVTDAASALGGQVVDYAKAQKVVAASKAIHVQLDRAVAMLTDKDSQDIYTFLQEEYLTTAVKTDLALLDNNAVSYKQLVNAMGATTGLSAAADIDKRVRDNKHLKSGLRAIISEVYKQKIAKITLSYEKSIDALKALQKVHAELEANKELSLPQLLDAVGQLKALSAKSTTNS